MRWATAAAVTLMAAGAAVAAEGPLGPPPQAVEVSPAEAMRALEHAVQYALFHYQLDGEEQVGVPYRLGGKVTLEEFAQAVRDQSEEAARMGIDASGLVANAYAAAITGIRFYTGPTGTEGLARWVDSRTLYAFNSRPVELAEAVPGDLLFFRSPDTGAISGVALLAERTAALVRVVVASASRGRVVQTGIRVDGPYWQQRVAGLGRLLHAPPATASP